MAAGGVELRRSRPDCRSRSRVLRPFCLLQDPRGPTTPRSHFSATWGRRGRNSDSGSEISNQLSGAGRGGNVSFSGTEIRQSKNEGKQVTTTTTTKTSGRVGEISKRWDFRPGRPSSYAPGKGFPVRKAASSIGRSGRRTSGPERPVERNV